MARTGLVAATIMSLVLSFASLMIASHPNDRTDLPARVSSNIHIYSDLGLATYADRGSGTESDPYVIENRNLSAESYGIAYLDITNTRSHLVIRNIDINGNEGTVGMYLINVTNVVLENCRLYNAEIRAFWLKNIIISNSYLYACGIDIGSGWVVGSDLTGNSNIAIAGNEVLRSQLLGIRLTSCENATETDNTVSECNTTGLDISRSENVLVNGNKLTGNLGGLSVWDSEAVTIVAFRRIYREIDVLLIDDIQFIAGKEATQEEYFHTFNHLHSANKQIVISSERHPGAIPTLEERVRSRFEGGMITDIQPPDLEMRIAILRTKADALGAAVPMDVIDFIAHKVQGNMRELEGALTRVLGYAQLMKSTMTVEMANTVLQDILRHKPITIDQVLAAVADFYRVDIAVLTGRSRQ